MDNLFNKLGLGSIVNIEKMDSSQNDVYKISTIKEIYLVKKYSRDSIRNEDDLRIRKIQIDICNSFNNCGISSVLPIKFNDEYFVDCENNYYLIYNYLEYKVLKDDELMLKHIRVLASTMAKIHKLKLEYDLPIQYKNINIELDEYIDCFKNRIECLKLYELLVDNEEKLLELINDCNKGLFNIMNDLCISHNDYKLKNILWDNDKMYLIDFDACSLSNPIVSLVESAFVLSRQNGIINYDCYKEYINSYIDVYGEFKTNYMDALDCAMNGKLQWFKYLLDECMDGNKKRIDECMSMIKELKLFIENKDKLKEVF